MKTVQPLSAADVAALRHASDPTAPASAIDDDTPLYTVTQIVRKLNVEQGTVYRAIRDGKLHNYGNGSRTLLRLDEAEEAFSTTNQRTLTAGDIISWNRKASLYREGGRTLALVEGINVRAGVVFTIMGERTGTQEFGIERLKDRLTRGEVQIEDPIELLQFIARQFVIQGRQELADALTQFAVDHDLIYEGELPTNALAMQIAEYES